MSFFFTDTRGNASLLAAFLMVILVALAVVVYTGATLYSTYQTAQTELERAANVSVDLNLDNANVRDLVLSIPAESAIQQVQDNLELAGYIQTGDKDWERVQEDQSLYCLRDMEMTVSGQVLDITATLTLPLPWAVDAIGPVELPLHIESRVLYLN